jgi:hydrogenase maturation protein HypF
VKLSQAADIRKRVEIRGVVQGVGFRPFVYRIAKSFDIRGWVLNSSGGAVIEAEGGEAAVEQFLRTLAGELPPLARIDEIEVTNLSPSYERDFVIRESTIRAGRFALVPPDVATCTDCLREITTVDDRRYGYPFTNCTNCGPRYTIIGDVPYDRSRTTMEPFRMCSRCQAEYEDPTNRRFHAEANACPQCGPSLALVSAKQLASGSLPRFEAAQGSHAILARVQNLLRDGAIMAIKGLGGFHLACDAANDTAVGLLRERKRRSGKAFAIMARNLATAERLCEISETDRSLLAAASRPVVLMRRRGTGLPGGISANLAPGTAMLGVMLPYTPLHHLLFEGSPGFDVLVMTSGNVSEEPIVSVNEEAWPRLRNLADHFLFHNRDIQTRVDDSVVQAFEGRQYPLRRSRGFAPEPIDLEMPLREILACGGELKNTLCLTKDRYAILSQHIGDLENLETMEFFRETLGHLQRFFRVSPVAAAHDLHPNYLSTRFALEESGLKTIGIQHHHAHIASCMADNGLRGRVIGVALDGTGYGLDGRIWGGEFLTCSFGGFERRGHLRYVPLAGGDSAIRQPWRSALAYLRAAFGPRATSLALPMFEEIPARRIAVVETMLSRNVQTIETSSCGRLFDAVASILGLRHETTYEGQAAIELEMAAAQETGHYPFAFTGLDPFEIDMRPAIVAIVEDFQAQIPVGAISSRFHRTMSRVVVDACMRIRQSDDLNRVCLSGGTFQNLRLLGQSAEGLRQRGFEVFTHHRVPPNDGGLSLGQALIANEILLQ